MRVRQPFSVPPSVLKGVCTVGLTRPDGWLVGAWVGGSVGLRPKDEKRECRPGIRSASVIALLMFVLPAYTYNACI